MAGMILEQLDSPDYRDALLFENGFVAGLRAYARGKGEPTGRLDNELLRRLADEQGRQTLKVIGRLMGGRP
jgi:hypothetical protein